MTNEQHIDTPPSSPFSLNSKGKIYKTEDEFIRHIMIDSKKLAMKHHEEGIKKKKYRNITGIPPIIIPVILAPLSQTFDKDPSMSLVVMGGLIISGIFSSADHYFNFGKKSEEHFSAETKYLDIVSDIEEFMAKDDANRVNKPIFVRTIRCLYDSISEHAPVLA